MRRLLFTGLLVAAAGYSVTACTTTRIVSPGGMSAMGPVLTVERFLQAVNARNLHGMASLFGTADGPMIETGGTLGCAFKKMGSWIGLGDRCMTIQEVELQMDLIAEILTHQDYTVVNESQVPGRVSPTSRVGVNLAIGGRNILDVPFMVVQSGDGGWLIEEIDLERVTGR